MENVSTGLERLSGPELEYFLLARLERVASRLADPRAREIPAWQALARHATAVAYQDRVAFGLADEAAVILSDAIGAARLD
jgi:hypothetical protein